jgi:Flp pilus assembly protein protease CpaA
MDSTQGWWIVLAAFFGLALSYAMFAFGILGKSGGCLSGFHSFF